MARRYDRDRVLVARIVGAAQRGVTPAELVALADGRADLLERALVRPTKPGDFDSLIDWSWEETIREAVTLARGG